MSDAEFSNRFWARVDKSGDCWLWTGAKTKAGYGTTRLPRRGPHTTAHRVAYMLEIGPIPDGHHVHHECMRVDCVRPEHLRAVTPSENSLMSYSPNVGAAAQRAKTHCPQGHPYEGANLRVARDGRRVCKSCSRANWRRWYAKRSSA